MIPFAPGVPLDGVLWTHTPGDPSGTFDAATRDLSNHYWSGPVDAPFEARPPWPCRVVVGPFRGDPGLCPACAAAFPSAWVGGPLSVGFCDSVYPEGEPVVALPGDFRDTVGLFPDEPPPWWMNPNDEEWSFTRWVAVTDAAHSTELGLRYSRVADDGRSLVRVLREVSVSSVPA